MEHTCLKMQFISISFLGETVNKLFSECGADMSWYTPWEGVELTGT